MCDTRGVIYNGREKGMNPYKVRYQTNRTDMKSLEDAFTGADIVFKGARSSLYDASHLSVDQLKTMVSQNMAQGKKVYVQKSGNLFPVSRDFLEERREVAVFIKSIASQMFTEKVDIVAYK